MILIVDLLIKKDVFYVRYVVHKHKCLVDQINQVKVRIVDLERAIFHLREVKQVKHERVHHLRGKHYFLHLQLNLVQLILRVKNFFLTLNDCFRQFLLTILLRVAVFAKRHAVLISIRVHRFAAISFWNLLVRFTKTKN